jgi:hypothetical protein
MRALKVDIAFCCLFCRRLSYYTFMCYIQTVHKTTNVASIKEVALPALGKRHMKSVDKHIDKNSRQ